LFLHLSPRGNLDLVPKGRDEDGLAFTIPGFAITTVTRMDTWPIRISRTGQQTLFPDIEYLNALERLWPVVARMTSCQGGSLGALEN
jgi:hypothetical protein